ncbi:MAG: nitroreductase [Candidatus Aminicenantes bacterium]|nr:nitroreductase [Candidatus Aminicenantes bacterium]
MDVTKAVHERRAFRSLLPADITGDLVRDLARHAQLAPSCFNNQPVRFVFVGDPAALEALRPALSEGNRWAHDASLVVAVFSRKEDGCVIRDREYHQFDCGLAAAFLILRATELGLVAHPIAGFSPKKVREALGIPDEYQVITLIVCGRRNPEPNPVLSEKQKSWELERPERLPLERIAFLDRYRKTE